MSSRGGGQRPIPILRNHGIAGTDQPHNKFGRQPSCRRAKPGAFVYVDQKTGQAHALRPHQHHGARIALVSQGESNGGYKVQLPQGPPLQDMTSVNLIFEGNERFILAEALTMNCSAARATPSP